MKTGPVTNNSNTTINNLIWRKKKQVNFILVKQMLSANY